MSKNSSTATLATTQRGGIASLVRRPEFGALVGVLAVYILSLIHI